MRSLNRLLLISLIFVTFQTTSAFALPIGTLGLKVSSGNTSVTIYDGNAGDTSGPGQDGVIVFNGAVGQWTINSITAEGPAFLGVGKMQLSYSDSSTVVNNGILSLGTVQFGSGYIYGTYHDVALTGGKGSGATADITIAGGNLKGLSLITAGSGYVYGTYHGVALTGGSGTGATADVTISGGNITTLGGVNAGTGYVYGTYHGVALTGGSGSGATADVTISGGNVTSLGAITAGTGYVNGTYTGVALTGGSGTGATATITVVNNKITSITMTNRGTGYYSTDVLSANNAALGGKGAGFSVKVGAVGVTDTVTLKNAGTGYYANDVLSANSAQLGGSGAGFSVKAGTVGVSDSVALKNAGTGYYANETLTVNNAQVGGKGAGFSLKAGTVGITDTVTLKNHGTGYLNSDILSVNNAQLGGKGSGFSVKIAKVDLSEPQPLPAPLKIWFTAPHQTQELDFYMPVVGTQSYATTFGALYYDPANGGNNYFTTSHLLGSTGTMGSSSYSYAPTNSTTTTPGNYALTEYLEIDPVAGQHAQKDIVQFTYQSAGDEKAVGVPEPQTIFLLAIGLVGLTLVPLHRRRPALSLAPATEEVQQ